MRNILILLFYLWHFQLIISLDSKIVNTTNGLIKGYLTGDEYIWLGIPFAKPPIGGLRYKKPEKFSFQKEIFEANKMPNACIQIPGDGFLKPTAPLSEDCLYLNIYAPKETKKTLPVVIWIYGGGYTVGAASILLYNPQVFVKFSDVVFVAIQYRIGSLGFLYTGNEAGGNMGLYDQAMAIKWVHENIMGFGGDPNKITLMGQSAGANSVAIHILSAITNQYFHSGILQSSGLATNWGFLSHSEAISRAKNLGQRLGCTDFQTLENCLRNKSAIEILQNEFFVAPIGINFYPFVPVEDGQIIEKDPKLIMKEILEGKKKIKKGMSILIGSNANEGYNSLTFLFPNIFNQSRDLTEQEMTLEESQFKGLFDFIFKDYTKEERQEILKQYPHDGTPTFYFRALDQMAADYSFVCSTEEFAQANSKSGNAVYRYYYDYHSEHNPSAKWTGSKHGDELEFTFGVALSGIFPYKQFETYFTINILSYWSQFISTGIPASYSYKWPSYVSSNWTYTHLHPNSTAICFRDFFEKCDFWINKLHF